ncbi:pyridoxamine 5'-phosphate oxidase family protein [Chloroflexota bacterium]
MAKLSEEAKKVIGEVRPALVATAGKDGKPNVSIRYSLRVLDDEHVIFTEIKTARFYTLANLKENPKVSAIVFDPATEKGCRIWGKAEILDSGELFDKNVAASAARERPPPTHVIKIAVEEVVILPGKTTT